MELATVIVSVGFMFTTSFVLMSCLSCRKFMAKRRLKKEKRKQEKVNIPEIKIDFGEQHEENGIANPVYEEGAESKAEESLSEVKVEQTTENTIQADAKVESNLKKEADVMKTNGASHQIDISGTENDAFQEIHEHHKENIEDISDVQSKESEPIKSDEEDVFETHVEEQKSSPEPTEPSDDAQVELQKWCPTKLYNNDLSEEELDAYNDVVFQGEWRRPVALRHLLEIGLIDKEIADEVVKYAANSKQNTQTDGEDAEEEIPEKLRRFLRGEEPVAGILVTDSGEKKSIFKSAKEGILRRGTAISLLEAQAATGNIIDPVTGRKVSVKEAAQLGLLDRVYETVLLRAERAVTGYKFRASEDVLSLFEAMQKGLVVESHGLRLLEAQCATGGIIDHRIDIRVPLDVAVQRGLLDDKLKDKLEDDDGEETKTFFDPNTEENVTYKELMKRSVVDNDTGLRLYPLERVTRKRLSYGSYSGRSSQASSRNVSRSNSQENIHSAVESQQN